MTRNIKAIYIAIILLFAPALVRAQVTAPPRVLSEGEQQVVVRRGAAVFAANCTGYCHGEKGTAGSGAPALANRGLDGDYISKTVLYGVPTTAMLGYFRLNMSAFIDSYHNEKRLHSELSYRSPVEFEGAVASADASEYFSGRQGSRLGAP